MKIKNYLAAADVLRVIAISIVAWYHFWQLSWLDPGFSLFGFYVDLWSIIRAGYMMVDVMLVLSGFLLALPYAQARVSGSPIPSIRVYFRRRFWRIFPSYALALLLTLILYAMPQGLYSSPETILRDLLAHLSFTHNLIFETYFLTPMPTVLWTLAVEVQFYLLFPLLARCYRKNPWLTCLCLAAAAFLYRAQIYSYEDTTIWINQLPAMLDLYACGMAAALLYTRWQNRLSRLLPRVMLSLGSLVCLGLLFQILYIQPAGDYEAIRRGQLLWRLPIGLLSGSYLLGGCLSPVGVSRILGNPITRLLSDISYNFYIWHQFLAVRLREWHIPPYTSDFPYESGEQPWQLQYMLICFLAAGLLAAALTFLWEKPLFRWGMSLSTPHRPSSPSPARHLSSNQVDNSKPT